MAKQKKVHKHRFVECFPALAAVILALASIFILQILGAFITLPFALIPGLDNKNAIGFIIISLLAIWYFRRWFYPEFDGMTHGGDIRTGIRLSCFIVIYWVICFPVQFMFTNSVFGWPTLSTLSIALIAGFTEEIAFRGMPVAILMRQWRSESGILKALLLSSAVFGLFHVINLGAGANFGSTIIQVIGAFAMGCFLCGIYLRSGNLWITIAVHALHDLLCFLDVSGIQDGVVVGSITWFSYLDLAFSVGLGVLGIWMVRPSKRAEIRRLWNEKWSISQEAEENN